MKQQKVIAVLGIAIFLLFIRLQGDEREEIVDLAEFTDYYEHSLADNGGLELTDSFYTFEKTYNFPGEYLDISREPKKEETVAEEKKKVVKTVYTIQKGDTLAKIAQKNGISMDSILANNPKMNKNLVIGTTLNIVSEDGVFYKLQKGDSVSRIAVKYKVKTADILAYNNITPKKMKVGEEVFLKSPDYKTLLEKEKPKLSQKELDKKLREKQEQETYAKNKKTGQKSTTASDDGSAGGGQSATSGEGFAMPVRYAGVSSPYGNRFHPVLRRYILHTGVDLVAKYVPLRAARAGVVSFAGNMSGYGKIIIIKHDNGYETRYAHLSQISTRVGERVEKGELIGKTGNTGRTTGPHLHFEIRRYGKTLNPMKYL